MRLLSLFMPRWHEREVWFLLLSLVMAVTFAFTLTRLTERVYQTFLAETSHALGADRVLVAEVQPGLSVLLLMQASTQVLSQSISLYSMVEKGDQLLLTNVKSVDGWYPLYGGVLVQDAKHPEGTLKRGGPPERSVWAEAQLLKGLQAKLGDTIRIGDRHFKISGIILDEPDRLTEVFLAAPRLIANYRDLSATGLFKPGAHMVWRYYYNGSEEQLRQFKHDVTPLLLPGQSIEGPDSSRSILRDNLNRAKVFLSLCTVLNILLCGVAAAIAARRYAKNLVPRIGLLRTFGLSRSKLQHAILASMGIGILVVLVLGIPLGYFAEHCIALYLQQLIHLAAGTLSWQSWAVAGVVGLLGVVGFVGPAVWPLASLSPASIFQQGSEESYSGNRGVFAGILSLSGILVTQLQDLRVAFVVLGGSFVTVWLVSLIATRLIQAIGQFRSRIAWVNLAIAPLGRYPERYLVPFISIALMAMVMATTHIMQTQLLTTWENRIPPNAPNLFMINLDPDDVARFEAVLDKKKIEHTVIYPLVRGPLTSLNGESIVNDGVQRPLNVTYTDVLPPDNEVVAGEPWDDRWHGQQVVSMELDAAKQIGARLGDMVTLRFGEMDVEAKIIQLRKVEWDSLLPNFFVIFPKGSIEDFPTTYMTALYIPKETGKEAGDVQLELSRDFTDITFIDIRMLLKQASSLLSKVTYVVSGMLLLCLVCGIWVMWVMGRVFGEEKQQAFRTLTWLGASRRSLLCSFMFEYALIGTLSVCCGIGASAALGWWVASDVFQVPMRFDWLWMTGMGVTVVLSVMTVGAMHLKRS